MMYEAIDKRKVVELVRAAKVSGDLSSDELGNLVSNMCKIVMSVPLKDGHSFNGYSEDWQLEMYGNATLAVYRSIPNIDLEKDVFNYIYQVITNSYKKTLAKLYRLPVPIDDCITNNSFCDGSDRLEAAKERRRTMKGFFALNEKRVFEAGSSCKRVLLQTVLRNAVNHFVKSLSVSKMDKLIRMARKNREALC